MDTKSKDLNTQETLHTQHTKSLRCVKFSHSGQSLAVASFDSHLSIMIAV